MQKIILIPLTLVFLISLAFADFIFQEYTATPSSGGVVIEWVTKSEAGIMRFAVMRSTNDVDFIEVGSVSVRGVGTRYSFADNNVVFKDSQTFFYKLRAINTNGETSAETEQSLIVHPNISGIYRTWGAIKAMFR